MQITFRGTREELRARLALIAPVLAGRVPDTSNVAEGLLLRVGMTLLGKMQDAYVKKSEGGTDDMGIQWQPLSPVTLALRRKEAGARTVERLKAQFDQLPATRRTLITTHYERLKELYRANTPVGAAAKKHAVALLELMQPFISETRYRKLKSELTGRRNGSRDERLALAGAYALILRDTGRMLASLSPQINSPDRVLRVGAGAVTVGSNVDYFKYHQSDQPRRLKKDGTAKLPRRQILPDRAKPIPAAWWRDMKGAFARGLSAPDFWLRFLGERAAVS